MFEFIQAYWVWLLIAAGVIWFVFRKGSDGTSSHASHGSESSRTKETSSDDGQDSHVEGQPRYQRRRRHGC